MTPASELFLLSALENLGKRSSRLPIEFLGDLEKEFGGQSTNQMADRVVRFLAWGAMKKKGCPNGDPKGIPMAILKAYQSARKPRK